MNQRCPGHLHSWEVNQILFPLPPSCAYAELSLLRVLKLKIGVKPFELIGSEARILELIKLEVEADIRAGADPEVLVIP